MRQESHTLGVEEELVKETRVGFDSPVTGVTGRSLWLDLTDALHRRVDSHAN